MSFKLFSNTFPGRLVEFEAVPQSSHAPSPRNGTCNCAKKERPMCYVATFDLNQASAYGKQKLYAA